MRLRFWKRGSGDPTPPLSAPDALLERTKDLVREYDLSLWTVQDLDKKPTGNYGSHKKMENKHSLDDTVNLVGSKSSVIYKHIPIFDFDFPVEVVESSTPGHFHVYLKRSISWEKYREVLRAMATAGLIQEGWYREAMKNKCATLRPPHVLKKEHWQSKLDALSKI